MLWVWRIGGGILACWRWDLARKMVGMWFILSFGSGEEGRDVKFLEWGNMLWVCIDRGPRGCERAAKTLGANELAHAPTATLLHLLSSRRS